LGNLCPDQDLVVVGPTKKVSDNFFLHLKKPIEKEKNYLAAVPIRGRIFFKRLCKGFWKNAEKLHRGFIL
jgi:hypothetical protein